MIEPRRRGLLGDEIDSKVWVVTDPESGVAHSLNESALAIWHLCDGATTPSEMAIAISELTGADLATTTEDVEGTLHDLREAGLIID